VLTVVLSLFGALTFAAIALAVWTAIDRNRAMRFWHWLNSKIPHRSDPP